MSALAALAGSAGISILEKILTRKLGDGAGQLATEVLSEIAARLGVPVDQLESLAETEQTRVVKAMREVEAISPELIALSMKELELQSARMQAEEGEPLWARAWRPGGMYLIGFLWLWNVVILHVINAIWKVALPAVPFAELMQLSGLYFGLYMGGHTVKDVFAKWAGAR